jgi:YD repeat-containing protein
MLAASFDQSYVDVTSGAGTRTRYFDKDGSNVYRSAGGIGSSLKKNAGGDWTESFPDGFQYNYTSSGLASSIVSPAGARWTIARDGGNRITSITDPANQRTTLAYDGSNKLESVTDPYGRQTNFSVGREKGDSHL